MVKGILIIDFDENILKSFFPYIFSYSKRTDDESKKLYEDFLSLLCSYGIILLS